MADIERLRKLAGLIRYYSLVSAAEAGSGHPTSSLSAAELCTALFFGGHFRFDADNPEYAGNDRLVFSKGHASPLFYSLWAAAGKVSDVEMLSFRDFDSTLEGHPTSTFRYTEAATGSLGQGLSIGVGLALNAKLDEIAYRTFVLLGDSEMAEGSQWEAVQIAAHYGLDNLIGLLDVNRLGQRGETMYGHDLEAYEKRLSAFGWRVLTVQDGHDFQQVLAALDEAVRSDGRPVMIVARTLKGKGAPGVEDQNGWHGKPLTGEDLDKALRALGEVDKEARGELAQPVQASPRQSEPRRIPPPEYEKGGREATRTAYGNALKRIYPAHPEMVVLDGEVSNSTRAKFFKEVYPDRFLEMYIAEQNMAGAAIGLARRGKKPFASSFAAFWSRAYDQIRMSQYSDVDIVFCGSHAGVSIGEDGPSQMGLEDIAFFRTLFDGTVLYPCDAYSTERLVEEAAGLQGITYIRTTRGKTAIIYGPEEQFPIGGCKVLRSSEADKATVVAAGITLHEALAASDELEKDGIAVRVVDLYSVKPLDEESLRRAAGETGLVLVVEDHAPAGGLGEAVMSALAADAVPVHSLAVNRRPRSGTPEELLDMEDISRDAIITKIKELA
jgi:transketolase